MKHFTIVIGILYSSVILAWQPLAPTNIEVHPELSPVNSIHLNHFNTGAADMEAPGMGKLDVKRINYGKVKFFNRWGLNMCGSSIVGKFMATNY